MLVVNLQQLQAAMEAGTVEKSNSIACGASKKVDDLEVIHP